MRTHLPRVEDTEGSGEQKIKDDRIAQAKIIFCETNTERGNTVWAFAQHAGYKRINKKRFGRGKVTRGKGKINEKGLLYLPEESQMVDVPCCVDFSLLFVW